MAKKSPKIILLESQEPLLVDFYADWCGPCQTLAPVLEKVVAELQGKVTLFKVNVDKHPQLAQQFARVIGTVLADPILGVVPAIASAASRDEALEAVLYAYNYMASQKLDTVAKTVARLDTLTRSRPFEPAIRGLLAEMRRVAGRLRVQGETGSAEQYLELAEEALSLDLNDITCRMALGFAKLNAGQTHSAFEIGKSILDLSPPVELLA